MVKGEGFFTALDERERGLVVYIQFSGSFIV